MSEYELQQEEQRIARFERVSTPALKAMILEAEAQRKAPYYYIATSMAEQGRLASELLDMNTEYVRRLEDKIAEDDAATDLALSYTQALIMAMRKRSPIVRGADLSYPAAAE